MARIDDVAKAAGVSKGTVSSVFSRKRPISREVTERVLEVARELGYYPNHLARSLAIRKTMIAGLKMPLSKDGALSGFEIQMINGVTKELSKEGYRVLLDTLPEDDDPVSFSIDPVDGVILMNPTKEDRRIARLTQMGIPLVLVGRPDPLDSTISYVDNDNERLAYEVGLHLLEQGHTKVLFLNASQGMTVAADRESGLMRAFAERGVPFNRELVLHYSRAVHSNSTDYGRMALHEAYSGLDFTAVIADTDRVALGVYHAARQLGLSIPERLSVIALSNDARLAQEMAPKLTTVDLFGEALGMEAAGLLVQLMKGTGAVERRILDARLIVRDSSRN